MTGDEINDDFEEIKRSAEALRKHYSTQAQAAGYICDAAQAIQAYWVGATAQYAPVAHSQPILASGQQVIVNVKDQLRSIQSITTKADDPLSMVARMMTVVASTTINTSNVLHVSPIIVLNHEDLPPSPFSSERSLADRLKAVDPALAATCASIHEVLYGTTHDPARGAVYLMRQVYDHFFDKLVPDDEVRNAPGWKQDPQAKQPNQVTRAQRLSYAIRKFVRSPEKQAALESTTKNVLETYRILNQSGHVRGEIDEEQARTALYSMYYLLEEWAEAMGL